MCLTENPQRYLRHTALEVKRPLTREVLNANLNAICNSLFGSNKRGESEAFLISLPLRFLFLAVSACDPSAALYDFDKSYYSHSRSFSEPALFKATFSPKLLTHYLFQTYEGSCCLGFYK